MKRDEAVNALQERCPSVVEDYADTIAEFLCTAARGAAVLHDRQTQRYIIEAASLLRAREACTMDVVAAAILTVAQIRRRPPAGLVRVPGEEN